VEVLKKKATAFGSSELTLLHLLWLFRMIFRKNDRVEVHASLELFDYVDTLKDLDLIYFYTEDREAELREVAPTAGGREFLRRLMLHPGIEEASEGISRSIELGDLFKPTGEQAESQGLKPRQT
jgi:hypothetical protein